MREVRGARCEVRGAAGGARREASVNRVDDPPDLAIERLDITRFDRKFDHELLVRWLAGNRQDRHVARDPDGSDSVDPMTSTYGRSFRNSMVADEIKIRTS